jgi:uncharacterized protein involved in exopolysaccharide biosynthesis
MGSNMDNPNNNSTLQRSNTSTLQPLSQHDPDEINLLEYIYALAKNKWWIIGAALLGLVLGYGAAYKKGPRWVAEVLIAPKEADSQKAPSFSGLGAFGGLVASQLNMGGNASLDKIDLILDSRVFSGKLVEKYDLLPSIYRYQFPKVYKKIWDSTQQKWKPGFFPPPVLSAGGMVKSTFLKKVTNKNNTMLISTSSKDSTLSYTLAEKYVSFLNEYIKTKVQSDAQENVAYLDKQLTGIADPLLREKIQTLISSEIEKQMVVSKEAFRIVDPLFLSKTFKEKRIYPPLFGFMLFFLVCLFIIFQHAFASSEKSEEDKVLISKLKGEIFCNPNKVRR